MTNQLFALALNPNLTENQFMELSRQVMESQAKILQSTCDKIVDLDCTPIQKIEILTKMLPFIMS